MQSPSRAGCLIDEQWALRAKQSVRKIFFPKGKVVT
jgi:hypothetical protein